MELIDTMFKLLCSLDKFFKWNLEQFATKKTGGGARFFPPPALNRGRMTTLLQVARIKK